MIAVTGANGLLGSFIVRKLLAEGMTVVAVMRRNASTSLLEDVLDQVERRDADVLDAAALTEAFAGADTVIHTAAMVAFHPGKAKQILKVNVEGTRNVVNTCLAVGVRKLVHISSVAALGRVKEIQEIDEKAKWVDGALNSNYGQSKYLAELEVYRGMEEGLLVTLINPSTILAPADWNNSSAQVFQYAWSERPFYTDGTLNFVDVRDVADMAYNICVGDFPGQKFIASAGAASIHSFFREIAKRFDKKPPYIRIGHTWTGWIAVAEEIRSWITRKEPLITRESARLARETFFYKSEKAKDLLNIQFRTLAETLDWCCQGYLQKITGNK